MNFALVKNVFTAQLDKTLGTNLCNTTTELPAPFIRRWDEGYKKERIITTDYVAVCLGNIRGRKDNEFLEWSVGKSSIAEYQKYMFPWTDVVPKHLQKLGFCNMKFSITILGAGRDHLDDK